MKLTRAFFILKVLIITPQALSESSTACSDRKDAWTIKTLTKNWCKWAQMKETIKRCKGKRLYDDCPETCGNVDCIQAPGPIISTRSVLDASTPSWNLVLEEVGEVKTDIADLKSAFIDQVDEIAAVTEAVNTLAQTMNTLVHYIIPPSSPTLIPSMNSSASQSAYLNWKQVGLDIDGEKSYDQSGYSVSLSADGKTVAIGAPYNDGNGKDSGNVRVYQWIGGSWTQVGTDIDGEAKGDTSGISVSLSADGKTVAIGARQNDGNGDRSGHVRVYQLNGVSWAQVGFDIDGEAAVDFFGKSVSLSADAKTVAIGAPHNDGNGVTSGHVCVFQLVGGSWTQVGSDIDGEAIKDRSGMSVSLSADGKTVAIGAPRNNGHDIWSGHVRVFELTGGSWTQVGNDIYGEASDDFSGYSVSLSADGKTVAIGAYLNDGNGASSGQVRVYQLIGGSWTQVGSDIDGETAGDESGYNVSLSADGKTVAIGAPRNNGNGDHSGHVCVFQLVGGSWTQVGYDIDGETAGDESGFSVALSADGKTVAIGAPRNDGINKVSSGHVRVYSLESLD